MKIMKIARHQQAGQHARHEQPSDRFLHQRAVQHHDDAGRDQNAQRAARRQRAEHDPGLVAARQHLGNGDGADRGRCGDARARDGGEHRAACDVGVQQPAGQAAQQHHDATVEVAADAAAQDDLAHQQKHRHGDQDVAVGVVPDDRRQRGQTEHALAEVQHQHAADAEREGRPLAGHQHDGKARRPGSGSEVRGSWAPRQGMRRTRSTIQATSWSSRTASPSTITDCGIHSGVSMIETARVSRRRHRSPAGCRPRA